MRPADRAAGDRGSVVAYVLLLAAALVVVLGLAVGGGEAMAAHQAAYAEAEEAARAGAAALAAYALRSGDVAVDQAAAITAAEDFMASSGHPGNVAVLGNVVEVSVSPYRVATPLLGIAGIASLTVSATASATVLNSSAVASRADAPTAERASRNAVSKGWTSRRR